MARTAHPIWEIVKEQGRSYAWLARKTGYSVDHVRHLVAGTRGLTPPPEFRRRAAELLQIPEWVLFDARPSTDAEAA